MNGISPVEMNGMVGRTQDFSIMKQHEDAKPLVDQGNFQQQVEKNTNNNSHTVIEGQKTETEGDNSGSKNPYAGDGGRNRKKKDVVPSQGRMLVKKKSGFDMSI